MNARSEKISDVTEDEALKVLNVMKKHRASCEEGITTDIIMDGDDQLLKTLLKLLH